MQTNHFIDQFNREEIIRKPELVSLLREKYPDAKPATLDWHIYDLVQQGLLVRRGRGRYQVISKGKHTAIFRPNIPHQLAMWKKKLAEAFPLLSTCLWSTQTLQPYLMHVPFIEYWLLEVDRDAVDSILSFVQSVYSREENSMTTPVILASDLTTMESYLTDTSRILLIKPLISEAPRQCIDKVMTTTAEKLIVDLITDSSVFFMYQEELLRIVEGITSQYAINLDKIRRYARRRNQLAPVNELLMRANVQLSA